MFRLHKHDPHYLAKRGEINPFLAILLFLLSCGYLGYFFLYKTVFVNLEYGPYINYPYEDSLRTELDEYVKKIVWKDPTCYLDSLIRNKRVSFVSEEKLIFTTKHGSSFYNTIFLPNTPPSRRPTSNNNIDMVVILDGDHKVAGEVVTILTGRGEYRELNRRPWSELFYDVYVYYTRSKETCVYATGIHEDNIDEVLGEIIGTPIKICWSCSKPSGSFLSKQRSYVGRF